MCGILGQIGYCNNKLNQDNFKLLLETQGSRGPDFCNVIKVHHEKLDILLGHNRLSIIDLSESANQPMTKDNVWIVFNGEIYNYESLRNQYLSQVDFQSQGDTEVILNLYLTFGPSFVELLEGFFSISIVDLNKSKLYLIRDRFGVKPLFLYQDDKCVQFASTLFPFNNNRNLRITINNESRNEYFIHGYMRSTGSIYNEVESVCPGSIVTIDLLSFHRFDRIFFNLEDYFVKNKKKYNILSLEKVLFSCFKKRLVSDVPVGILLSGGVDSNLVALGLSFERQNNFAAFTVSFDRGNDELEYAVAGNRLHKYEHFIKKFSNADFSDSFSNLIKIIDQPFGDSSIIPSYVISSHARKKGFKVLLSSDGGDEMFFGYNSYFKYIKYISIFMLIFPVLKIIGKMSVNKLIKLPKRLKNIDVLNEGDYSFSEWYYYLYYESIKGDFYDFFKDGFKPKVKRFKNIRFWQIPSISDFRYYLPNDILYKVDRSTMAAGVEGREPFLDPELLTIAGSLKFSSLFSFKKGGKLPLKSILNKYGLSFISNKAKTGFTVDFVEYLFKENNKLVEYYFSTEIIDKTQIFDSQKSKTEIMLQLTSDFDIFYNVLVYQIWYIFNFHNELYIDPSILLGNDK